MYNQATCAHCLFVVSDVLTLT